MTEKPTSSPAALRPLRPGDPAPWFHADCTSNPRYAFDTVAGRHVVLCFFGTAGDAAGRALLDAWSALRGAFDDEHACFFGVCSDRRDAEEGRLVEQMPGIRHFRDFDGNIARLFGVTDGARLARHTFVLDERLRVLATLPFTGDPAAHVAQVRDILKASIAARALPAAQVPAPVLVLPRVFEPALCRMLMDYYDAGGATDSGFMREVEGKTVGVYDYAHKRRADKEIEDERLRNTCMARIHDRVVPEIHKAFQFHVTRIERHIVACYDGENGGHFRAHRDNTTRGTAHRRFAVSVVLNSGEFEGGRLRFPEFGPQTYAPPPGGAVVFSCSLLHEATPVTRGRRYCYLPFLYDDAAARIRQDNLDALAGTIHEDAR